MALYWSQSAVNACPSAVQPAPGDSRGLNSGGAGRVSRRWRGVANTRGTSVAAMAWCRRRECYCPTRHRRNASCGQFEGTVGPRRRRATSVGFRVEPQAVGRARERVRRDRGARVRRHGELGHLGSGLQGHGSGAGDESCEGCYAHQAALQHSALSACSRTQLAASNASTGSGVCTTPWTADGLQTAVARPPVRYSVLLSDSKMQPAAERAGSQASEAVLCALAATRGRQGKLPLEPFKLAV